MNSWKPFLTRLAIFLILLYAVIPAATYKIGTKPQMTINVLYVPIAFAGMLAVFILLKKEELKNFKYAFSWKQTILFTILAYSLFTAYLVQQNQWWGMQNNLAHMLTGFALYGLGGIFLLLAVFNINFTKHFVKQIATSFAILIVYGGAATLLSLAGYPITRAISAPLASLLSITNKVTLEYHHAPTLTAGDFTATIGPPCTGITSLILFTGLFLFVVLLDWKKINKKSLLWIYPVGATGMFILAFLRLYILFLVGANWSKEFAMKGFHNNASWIIFVLYFLIYFYIAYPKMLNKQNRKL